MFSWASSILLGLGGGNELEFVDFGAVGEGKQTVLEESVPNIPVGIALQVRADQGESG